MQCSLYGNVEEKCLDISGSEQIFKNFPWNYTIFMKQSILYDLSRKFSKMFKKFK